MRTFSTALLAAGALCLAAAPAALSAPGGHSSTPSATGAGHFTPTTPPGSEYRTFSFNAKQHKDGSVTGQAQLHARRASGDIVIHAELDCLRVIGNTATMSGVVKHSRGPDGIAPPEGRPVTFSVMDNGEGADDPPDLISNFFLTPPSPFQGCNGATPPTMNVVENGNVQVRP